jgi:outer membrane protein OmpA-like peptidoglycan-associated protein
MGSAMRKIGVILALLLATGCQTPAPVAPSPAAPVTPPPHRPSVQMPPLRSAGPLNRADVETYMNAQESDLRDYLRGQNVLVSRRGNALAVTVQSDRVFAGETVTDWGDAFYRAMTQVLGHYDHTMIVVTGYSDNTGGEARAQTVSQARAKSVADGLIQYGIAAARLTATGLGATDLHVANAADPRNRRIVITITPTPR